MGTTKRIALFITTLSFVFLSPVSGFAQYGTNENTMADTSASPRQQLATIVFAGLAGAVLGLSTLSFYGRPQDKLSNIAVGFAVGIIAGASYTTYRTATKPYGGYSLHEKDQMEEGLLAQEFAYKPNVNISYQWDF